MKKTALFIFMLLCYKQYAQQIPVYGPEIPVTINSYTLDAMEPFISPDGNALFINSVNNGTNTAIYYAARVDDTTYNLVGLFPVVNQTVTPYLNAVASLDTFNNFYWVSIRNYPTDYDNLHHVTFTQTGYTNFGRVRGDFNIHTPGWLIMDAGVNFDGNYLYYCNGFFQGTACNGGLPCKARLGVAQKVNDSTFNKLANTDAIMASVNDTNYLVYAPCITADGLELYYTRFAQTSLLNTEICVAVRTTTLQPFGTPAVLYSANGLVPEAPTLTTDKSRLYYHKKVGSTYKIFMRYRQTTSGLTPDVSYKIRFSLTNKILVFDKMQFKGTPLVTLYSIDGRLLLQKQLLPGQTNLSLEDINMPSGMYIIALHTQEYVATQRFVIIE